MADDAGLPAENPGLDDPALERLIDAILDGSPIDWQSAGSSGAARFLEEYRALARLAAVHRATSAHLGAATGHLGQWGPLRLLEQIGEGAFGDVFRAWDTRLDREVALKLLRHDQAVETDAESTVITEASLLARVRHPNVVSVFGAERIDGRVGIWTEFVHGGTLAEPVQARGRLDASEAVSIGLDLCDALSAVHGAGLVHGDVKAQNVLREPAGRIVLVDLGTGHELRQMRAAEARQLGGTPLYMAPELWKSSEPTPSSDLYSVGVLLYYMVTGTYPVRGATAAEVRDAHEAGRRVRLPDERPDLPHAFAATVERALDPDPARRFATANEFRSALSRVAAGMSHGRRTGIALTVTTAAVVGIAAGALALKGNSDPPVTLARDVDLPAAVANPTPAGPVQDPTVPSPAIIPAPGELRTAPAASAQVRIELALPVVYMWGRPSRDGRYLPNVDPERFNVQLWDRATGEQHQVTNDGNPRRGANFSLASPDGRQIAYGWDTESGDGQELRIVNANGTGSRRLVPGSGLFQVIPLEWSRRGMAILAFLDQAARRRDLALVPLTGRSPRIVRTFQENLPASASLSPDGRFVAYAQRERIDDPSQDVFIARIDGGQPWALAPNPADDWNPLWTQNGDVLFVSNRGRGTDLWRQQVKNGVAQNEPMLVARNVDTTNVLGLSDDGTYFYVQNKDDADVFLASVDPDSPGSLGRPLRILQAGAGAHVSGNWSPDGTSFVYIDRQAQSLAVKTLATGQIREIKPNLQRLLNAMPRWSPDNKSVLVRGINIRNELGYFRVNLQSQETLSVVVFGASEDGKFGPFEWSPDGAAMNYLDRSRGIVRHEFAGGRENVIASLSELGPLQPSRFASSPNGRWLVVGGQLQGQGQLFKLRPEGGSFKDILRFPEEGLLQQWSADSQRVYYVRRQPGGEPFHLWAWSAASDVQIDLGVLRTWTVAIPFISIRPDDREVAFTLGAFDQSVWAIERLLAPAPRR